MHIEPTTFVLRAVPGLLQETFCVVQRLVARYAMRKRLTSPLFANAWRTAANIVCFHGHYTIDLCYVMRDDYANATQRTSITATISRRHISIRRRSMNLPGSFLSDGEKKIRARAAYFAVTSH
jgi:hypothetical protein